MRDVRDQFRSESFGTHPLVDGNRRRAADAIQIIAAALQVKMHSACVKMAVQFARGKPFAHAAKLAELEHKAQADHKNKRVDRHDREKITVIVPAPARKDDIQNQNARDKERTTPNHGQYTQPAHDRAAKPPQPAAATPNERVFEKRPRLDAGGERHERRADDRHGAKQNRRKEPQEHERLRRRNAGKHKSHRP